MQPTDTCLKIRHVCPRNPSVSNGFFCTRCIDIQYPHTLQWCFFQQWVKNKFVVCILSLCSPLVLSMLFSIQVPFYLVVIRIDGIRSNASGSHFPKIMWSTSYVCNIPKCIATLNIVPFLPAANFLQDKKVLWNRMANHYFFSSCIIDIGGSIV